MRRIVAIVAMAGILGGCSATPRGPARAPSITLAGPLGYPVAAKPSSTAASLFAMTSPPAGPAPKLLCDAPSLAYLVGRPRTEIPVAADLSKRRVTCATCPASEDHRPDRTDILFDAGTGRVTVVTCG